VVPITLTYPGVYVQELPGAGRAIHGVSTSVIAVIGYFTQGPPNQAVRIQNTGEFQRVFGGLDEASLGSYALLQFFNNGGAEAWVVRTAKSTTANPWQAAGITIQNAPNTGTGTPVLKATAANPGVW
jgi:phage tail sheath protein FI